MNFFYEKNNLSSLTKTDNVFHENLKFAKVYEYYSYELDTPLQSNPANNATQQKEGYRFTVDTTTASETVPDWYNAYLELDFKINKVADGTTYGAADN